jgi:hypothetical protein
VALSVFDDPDEPPDAAQIREALGATASLWRRVADRVAAAHGPAVSQWNFAGAKFGWSMRLKQGDRVLLHLTPCSGHFLAGISLGERAVAEAKAAGLPADVVEALDASPRYAEGRGLRLAVRTEAHADAVVALVGAKVVTTRGTTRATTRRSPRR